MFWIIFATLLFSVTSLLLGLWFLRHAVNIAETVIDKVSESEFDSSASEDEHTHSDISNRRTVDDKVAVQ